MRIGVLSNLRAGRGGSSAERLRRVLRRHRDVLHVYSSDNDTVEQALDRIESAGVDLLVLNGGDGTLQHALTRMLGAQPGGWLPLIAPLRGGSANNIARSLGAQRDPGRGLTELLEAVRTGALDDRIDERPVVRADLGRDGVQYGMFFGAGILYRAILLALRSFPEGRAQGVFGAGLTTAALIGRALAGRFGGALTPEKMQLVLDDDPIQMQEYLLVMATTLDRLFLRMRPFWGHEPRPLRLTTIAGRPRDPRVVAGVLRGRPPAHATPDAGYLSRNVHRSVIRLDGGMTLDGELFAPEPGRTVELSAEKRVRFVRS
jgi:hypothetical protein